MRKPLLAITKTTGTTKTTHCFYRQKIDALVYELYGLSEEEVKIVEGEIK
jgi:hypothetical protein